MNNLVSLFSIGPQRTASSWLDQALRAHPDLALPNNVKETFFFDEFFHRGFQWYFSFFYKEDEFIIQGEVGPTYFDSSKARERIYKHNPNALIIIMVRNPVARAFSSFGHEFAKGRVANEFFEALDHQPRIVSSGRYSVYAPLWEKTFGSENVLYLVQEEIEANPQAELNNVCQFLGVPLITLPAELQGRYGQGTIPRSPWLAAVASRTASTMRGAGLHQIVEIGKRLGLKRVYTGGNPDTLKMSKTILDSLLKEHETDIQFLEWRLGRQFPHWRDPATYKL